MRVGAADPEAKDCQQKHAVRSYLRASAMELVVLRMLSSDSALSLDEALLRLRVLAAGPASPVVASVKSLHKVMGE